jgi:hypothetical protein
MARASKKTLTHTFFLKQKDNDENGIGCRYRLNDDGRTSGRHL